ncbi:MAG: hypothetical protein IPJ23_19460 [Ignavibacteriales bacterium]|nr:hypothetical protein [Ignavibacteriales bacterium]
MKNTIKLFAFVIVLSFYTTGCYTIVWDPREEFPDTENSSESSSGDFYDYDYYGGYVSYYEAPWWIPPVVYITNPDGTTDRVQTKDRNNGRSSDTETIRNSNGRGNTDRNPGINTGTTTTTTTTTTNSGSSNNSNVVNTPPPTRNTGSDSSTNSTNSTSNTRNSGSNENRNSSSGSRNSGSGRR